MRKSVESLNTGKTNKIIFFLLNELGDLTWKSVPLTTLAWIWLNFRFRNYITFILSYYFTSSTQVNKTCNIVGGRYVRREKNKIKTKAVNSSSWAFRWSWKDHERYICWDFALCCFPACDVCKNWRILQIDYYFWTRNCFLEK